MKRLSVALIATLALAGCSSLTKEFSYPPGSILPHEAIQRAAHTAPKPVHGLFYVHVRATGRDRGRVYLNSELDYRDQRNVTVAIYPAAIKALEESLGKSVEDSFHGKSILVRGAAHRVKVDFYANGKPTDKYYYQTHIVVTRADQISVRGG